MTTYDYRIDSAALDKASANIDQLSDKYLIKLAEVAETLTHEDEIKRHENAMARFNEMALPLLQDYAEMTSSLLMVDELDEREHIVISLKNSMGFDITESCKAMRALLIMTENVGIAIEDDEVVLALIFDALTFIA